MLIRNDLKSGPPPGVKRAVNLSATMRFIYMQAARQPNVAHKNKKREQLQEENLKT